MTTIPCTGSGMTTRDSGITGQLVAGLLKEGWFSTDRTSILMPLELATGGHHSLFAAMGARNDQRAALYGR